MGRGGGVKGGGGYRGGEPVVWFCWPIGPLPVTIADLGPKPFD